MAGYYSVWKSISCLLSISTLIHIGVAGTTPSSVIDNYGACNGVWGQQLEVRAQPGQEKFIDSPGFPFSYPNYADCKWRISTNLTGYVIKLETVFVQLENRYDFLRVFDGNSTLSPILLQISTMSVARNLTTYSSGPSVYVTFTTDASTWYQGFRLRFMAVLNSTSDLSLACNSSFMPPTLDAYPDVVQNIRSMRYPSNYSNNAHCYWMIKANYGYVIQLYVREMDLGIGNSCNYDYLEFFDGNGIYSPILTKLCNSSLQYVNSTGQIMFLHFRSDESVVGKGFFLQYTAVPETNMPSTTTTSSVNTTTNTSASSNACNYWSRPLYLYISPGDTNFIESPNYPNNYPNGASCGWVISINSPDYVVELRTVYVNVERSDVIKVYTGYYDMTVLRSFSTMQDTPVQSTGQSMYVTFTSDNSVTYSGFRLSYTAVPRNGPTFMTTRNTTLQACSLGSRPLYLSIFAGETNFIQSPNYPNVYPNDAVCGWIISTYTSDYVVELSTDYVNLENNFDLLNVYDGSSIYGGVLLRNITSVQSTPVQSTGQSMYVTFTSDGSITKTGFNLSYRAVLRNGPSFTTTSSSLQACSLGSRPLYLSIFAGETNIIQSPNYPNVYPNNADCGWIISTYSSDYVVELSTDYVDLENRYDVIKVYDGSWLSDSILLRSISSNQSTPVQSTGQWMYVTFTSDSSTTKTGFRLSYRALLRNGPSFTTTSSSLQACSLGSRPLYLSIFAGETNIIQSPNYPNVYPNNADCGWIISTYSSDYVVELSTDYVDLENRYDVIKIYDGSSIYGGVLLRNISSVQSTPVQSTGQSMYVTFTSDFSTTKTGFSLSYRAVLRNGPSFTTTSSSLQACSLGSRPLYLSIFPGETNFIQSPNYPNAYPNNAVCGWIISTYTSDYVVELSTDYVDLENNYDLLNVYDGSSIYGGVLLQSISSVQDTPVQSTGQSMYVTFTSDGSTTNTGFRLSYTAVLRNGPSFTTTSSPSYHTAYESSSSLWLILGVVLGAIGIVALIISIIVVVKCRRRPRVPTARLCIPPAHMAGGYNNVFAQPGTQTMQLGNGIYVVPAPDPSMPTAIYASAPPAYDNIAFTACFNEPSRDIPQQPLENPMCSLHPETGDAPPEYSKIQHSDAACVA